VLVFDLDQLILSMGKIISVVIGDRGRVGAGRRMMRHLHGANALLLHLLVALLRLGHGLHDGLEAQVHVVEALVDGVAGEHALAHLADGVPALHQRQEDDHRRPDGAPRDRDRRPQREVAGAVLPRRQRQHGPQDHDHGRERHAPLDDPPLRAHQPLLLELLRQLAVGGDALHSGDLPAALPVVVLRPRQAARSVHRPAQQDGHQVARQHGRVPPGAVQVHAPVLDLGDRQPDGDAEGAAGDSAEDGADGVGLAPEQQQSNGDDGGAYDDAHGQVHPSQGDADEVEDDGEGAHEAAERKDDGPGHAEDLLAGGVRVDVGPVDVVGAEGGDGHKLSRARRGDGHEEHGEEENGAGLAHERRGGGGRDEALGRLGCRDREVQGERAEAQRGCQREGHREPHQPAEQVPLVRRRWPGGDRAHPVTLHPIA
jgi:hypothetical protein